jgi:S1-C subfamily serine protease
MDNRTEAPIPSHPLAAASDALAAMAEHVGRSTVGVLGRGRHGVASGIVWQPGILVTTAHAFRRLPEQVHAVGEGGSSVEARLVGADASTDIAVFRLPDEALPTPVFGDAASVKTGQFALAVGRSSRGELTASHGLVNRTAGAWRTWLGGEVDRLIRLDGGVHDGLSGAAVTDMRGSVVGMATAALSRGYGIVLPVATVSRVVEALLSRGTVARAFLGIGAQPVRVPRPTRAAAVNAADAADAAGSLASAGPAEAEPEVGLLVTSLSPGGPAEQAGLWVGDIVTDVAGRRATSLDELRAALAGKVGQPVPVGMLRGGAAAQASVTVGQWPARRHAC